MNGVKISNGQAEEHRFGFGKNWTRYLELVDDERIATAEQSLKNMLELESLEGLRFLDAVSGSGLLSLAARNLGAVVHSFDYDTESVGCTQALKKRCRPEDENWGIEQGDVLDEDYLGQLGKFDVVYSWGVLHHTGDMWRALGNMVPLVQGGGKLFVAIYNDQGRRSVTWKKIKRIYNKIPRYLRWLVLIPAFARLWGLRQLEIWSRDNPFQHGMLVKLIGGCLLWLMLLTGLEVIHLRWPSRRMSFISCGTKDLI